MTENNFYAIIMGSLPSSYDPYILALNATSSVLGIHLSADDLMLSITEEYERRAMNPRKRKKMLPSTLMLEKEKTKAPAPGRSMIKTRSATIAIRWDTSNQTDGRREAERKARDLNRKGKLVIKK